jgi:glycosyltransferase involved in cell wall biosynthesis
MPDMELEMPTKPGHTLDALRGRDMLCFSHDWSGDPLSKTHLMRGLARENRVLWVNSIGYRTPTASTRDLSRAAAKLLAATKSLHQPERNIHVLNPLIIPAYGRQWVRDFNHWFLRMQVRAAMRKLGFERPINWVFNPAAAVIAGSLDEQMLIYYCVDEFTAFSGVSSESLRTMERELLARAGLVIVSSERLLESKRQHNPQTVLVRHGVDWNHFRSALDTNTQIPADLQSLPGPVIGYFGLIADDWIDMELIAHVAQNFPQASIAMLGHVRMDVTPLKRIANIHFLGHKPYGQLPAYCRGFDVAMIPFPINQATLNANPLKAREYLAAGLPVISTAIPEVEVLGGCRIGRTYQDFSQQVEAALTERGPSAARSNAISNQSWDARLAEIGGHIAQLQAPKTGDLQLAA